MQRGTGAWLGGRQKNAGRAGVCVARFTQGPGGAHDVWHGRRVDCAAGCLPSSGPASRRLAAHAGADTNDALRLLCNTHCKACQLACEGRLLTCTSVGSAFSSFSARLSNATQAAAVSGCEEAGARRVAASKAAASWVQKGSVSVAGRSSRAAAAPSAAIPCSVRPPGLSPPLPPVVPPNLRRLVLRYPRRSSSW